MTITEFLLARIAEDEAAVNEVPEWFCTDSARGEGWGSRGDCPLCDAYMFDGSEPVTEDAMWDHLERMHNRTRVLAECAAKLRIVEMAADEIAAPGDGQAAAFLAQHMTLALASIYTNHPDFDPSWSIAVI